MHSSPPDIWSKLDDAIYTWRWYLVAALLGLTLIGTGVFFITKGTSIFQKNSFTSQISNNTLPKIEQVAGQQSQSGPIDINTASLSELDSLPGIGPTIGQRIIDYRTANGPFKKIEDLTKVKGIGPKTFAELKDKIIVK